MGFVCSSDGLSVCLCAGWVAGTRPLLGKGGEADRPIHSSDPPTATHPSRPAWAAQSQHPPPWLSSPPDGEGSFLCLWGRQCVLGVSCRWLGDPLVTGREWRLRLLHVSGRKGDTKKNRLCRGFKGSAGDRFLKSGIWNLEPGIRNPEPGTWNLEPGTWNPEPG